MISTHILDTSRGKPAAGVTVILEKQGDNGEWMKIGSEATNTDGRIAYDCPRELGTYRLTFRIQDYFSETQFFNDTQVQFHIRDTGRKYHVPLLVNPFGYSTYLGS